MVDSRFFHNTGALRLNEIASLTGAMIVPATAASSKQDPLFTSIAPLDKAGANDISFLDNVKYVESFTQSKAGACFIRPRYVERAPKGMILLVTDEPYYAYALTADHLYPVSAFSPHISPKAHIAGSATLGKELRIDHGVSIGENVQIGNRCWIGAGTIIDDNVIIGDDCRIGANCTISHTIIGHHCILHRGIHIGQDGFGFAAHPQKGIIKVPQLGRVIIGDKVEIGSGTCIDRGAGPDTVIGNGTKIDNLVQIGHNVQIGKNVIIVAQCGISGSTVIGDGAMLGGQVGITGHLRIGAGAKLAAQAGIISDIPAGTTYGGTPGVPIKDWHRQTIVVGKLIKKREFFDE